MKSPASFVPDSFEQDPPPQTAITVVSSVPVNIPASLSRFDGLELSQNLQYELDRAIESANGGRIYNWFKRARSKSRTETNLTRAAEISSISTLIITYATEAARIQRLPHTLAQQHRLEDLQFSVTEKTGLAALMLTEAATNAGLSVELYIKKLDKELDLDSRKEEIEQDLYKDRQLKTNSAVDEKRRSRDKIEVLSAAKNAQRQREKQLWADLHEKIAEEEAVLKDAKISDRQRQKHLEAIAKEMASIQRQIDELGQNPREATGNNT